MYYMYKIQNDDYSKFKSLIKLKFIFYVEKFELYVCRYISIWKFSVIVKKTIIKSKSFINVITQQIVLSSINNSKSIMFLCHISQ